MAFRQDWYCTHYTQINCKQTKGLDASPQPKQTTLCTFLLEQVAGIFVETCNARMLLGTVTRLFIPAYVHFLLFKCTLAYLFTVSPHV